MARPLLHAVGAVTGPSRLVGIGRWHPALRTFCHDLACAACRPVNTFTAVSRSLSDAEVPGLLVRVSAMSLSTRRMMRGSLCCSISQAPCINLASRHGLCFDLPSTQALPSSIGTLSSCLRQLRRSDVQVASQMSADLHSFVPDAAAACSWQAERCYGQHEPRRGAELFTARIHSTLSCPASSPSMCLPMKEPRFRQCLPRLQQSW